MLDLQNTTDLVKKELQSDLYLLEILKDDLVNVSALSRNLLPKIRAENPKATIESISIAIKRYVEREKKSRISDRLKKIIANTQLSTKNDIIHITFKRNQNVVNQISKISSKIEWDNEEIFFVNQGSGEITVIIDKKNKQLLDGCRSYLTEYTKNLAVLSLKELFQMEGRDIPGLYAYFISQISRNGINIIELASTLSQLTFVISENDITRAYEVINEKIKHFRRENKP
ncbi:hypothetical protein HYX06_03040 [Candidatus Woesearchaeota archaeon]|nr:hypothetical protein [Candidatus Woesearchaeota archaeon]